MRRRSLVSLWSGLLGCLMLGALIFCTTQESAIEDLADQRRWTGYQISLSGVRDGDLLPTRVVFETSSSKLGMDLRFRIGVPTRLESGQYHWEHDQRTLQGNVRARSVTFLGGQSDNPNLGGVFELLSAQGEPLYKVTLPTSEVRPSGRNNPAVLPSH